MSLYIMDGKTFQKVFAKKEDPDKILKSKFLIVSSRIRNLDKFRKNVIKANHILLPDNRLQADLGIYDNSFFEREYRKTLRSAKGFLSSLVYNSLIKNKTIILLCSENEWTGLGHLQLIAQYIEDEFHYPVYNYRKYKKGKEKIRSFDRDEVIQLCLKQQKEDRITYVDKKMRTDSGKKELLKELSTKEMKRMLINSDLYVKGMGKKQMKWTLKHCVFNL